MIFTTEDTEDTETEGRGPDGMGSEGKGSEGNKTEEMEGNGFEGRIGRVSWAVIGAAISVHRVLGPGLLESAYENCLAYELGSMGHKVESQRPLPLVYRGVHMECGYRLDMLVDDSVIVEVKAVESLQPIHSAQLLSYLKLSGLPLGLLINFNVSLLKQGIRRLRPPPPSIPLRSGSGPNPSPSVSVSSVSSVVNSGSVSVSVNPSTKGEDQCPPSKRS